MQVPSIHQLQDDPQTLGRLIQLVHGHDVSVAHTLHDLDFCREVSIDRRIKHIRFVEHTNAVNLPVDILCMSFMLEFFLTTLHANCWPVTLCVTVYTLPDAP